MNMGQQKKGQFTKVISKNNKKKAKAMPK